MKPTSSFFSLALGTCLLIFPATMNAAPSITSVPPIMAGGVSPTAPIVFTFSEAMNTQLTTVEVYDGATYQLLTAFSFGWTAANTVLTCTPTSPLPSNRMIIWSVDGKTAGNVNLSGSGLFTTAGGSNGTGCDPEAPMLSTTVSKSLSYVQTSSSTPASSLDHPYCFLACTTIPCPRDATNVTVRNPAGQAANMMLSPIPGHLTFLDCGYGSQAALDTMFPPGGYQFTIQAVASNQTVAANLPSNISYPPPPRISNFTACQTIDASRPFIVIWDPIPSGSASHCITLEVNGVFSTPSIGGVGAMNGTATSYLIPAGTLQPGTTYSCSLTFQNFVIVTNSSGVSLAYCGSLTEFEIATVAGSANLLLANPGLTNGLVTFEVGCTIGQLLFAEYSTNLLADQWYPLANTNSLSQKVRFTDPRTPTSPQMFYRVRSLVP